MPRINCYFPIKLSITGRLTDAQLEQLCESLVRALSARITLAEREIATHHNLSTPAPKVKVGEPFNPSREDDENSAYNVPSYQSGGRPISVSLHRRRRPWFIRRAVHFHSSVSDFLDLVDLMINDQSQPSAKVLYMDRYAELRWVALWLVQVNEEHTLHQLQGILFERATQLVNLRSNQVLAYAMGTTERLRRKLITIDEDGVVMREIPNLHNHNARLTAAGDDDDVIIRPGGWVLFAGMVLPKVEEAAILTYGPEVTVWLPLHELAFIVNGESFERLFGVSWNEHLREFGDQLAPLRILPFYTQGRAHFQTLEYLVEPNVALNVDRTSAYFGGLHLLNQSRIDWLPPAARTQARRLTNDLTLPLDESRREGWWEQNWAGAFVYAVVNATGEQPIQPEAERAGQPEPSETPERLIARFTNRRNLDEDGLGAYLVGLIRRSPAMSHYVQRVLDELGSSDRDDVSLAFAQSATNDDLDSLARSPNGRLLLVRLYDELTSGELDESERQQAERVMAARVRSRSIEVVTRRLERARQWIFPYRQPGPTVYDDSPIMAERLGDGRIRVSLPVRVGGTDMFRAEVRTLPSVVFSSGLVLDADEWISVKLYDEGGIIVQRPALYLLEIANQAETKTLHTIANVTATVAGFGVGGAVSAAGWGARTLVALDRAAVVLSVIGIVVNDHRGWLIQTFGEDGRTFVRAVEVANTMAGVYGLGRIAFASPRIISGLRNAWRNWRASRAYGGLQGADLNRAEELSQNTQQFLNAADEAADAMRREAAAVPTSAHTPPPTPPPGSGTPPRPTSTPPPGGTGAATGGAPRSVLYRGTTYRFISGRSRNIHDLGDGVYMTYDADLAVLYAQERRVAAQATDPGAPGIVLRVEAETSEMGRVLDFYYDRALRSDWETFVARQPGGDIVLRGGPAEMYNGHFQNWLRSRGTSLDDFDVIIGPEYIRGGSQVCIRNEGIAERLLNRADEWARAHEPVTPAYPSVPAPRVP
jgi:hypothetical protein